MPGDGPRIVSLRVQAVIRHRRFETPDGHLSAVSPGRRQPATPEHTAA